MEVFQKEITVSAAKSVCYPTGKRTVYKPTLVQDYNRYMGGVDRGDLMSSYHPFPLKCPKWYMRVFHHIIELSLILYFAYITKLEGGQQKKIGQHFPLLKHFFDITRNTNLPKNNKVPRA